MSLGERIKLKREALKLTQDQLAKASGLTSQYVSVIEQDKRSPAISSLAKIADELGTSIDYLVTGKEGRSLDLIQAIKADKTMDLEVRKSLITLIHELRKTK
jgi:transcriptional regulator with XRE-family HTH domain